MPTHARLTRGAAPLLPPCLRALLAAPFDVRLAALQDMRALLLAASPAAAAANRATAFTRPPLAGGTMEALLALALAPPEAEFEAVDGDADGACWWISGDVLLRRLGPTVTGYGSLAGDAQSRSKT